jgi:hypothetical protein
VLRHWAQLIHKSVLIERIHLLRILQSMYNKCVKKIWRQNYLVRKTCLSLNSELPRRQIPHQELQLNLKIRNMNNMKFPDTVTKI